MDNFLPNGAVLPFGLLGNDEMAMFNGFKKSYNNVALRIGVIVQNYPVSDDKNHSKLTTEYDVLVLEQQEDKGTTTLLYRNCMSAEGLGSMADFFEKTLRTKTAKTTKGDAINLKGQNGAIVLLLCLDGMSDKGIIIGALTHPDRPTTLVDSDPHLEGEYNGVNIKVEDDGSTTLTFKGATDNDGKVIDSSQGDTTIKIEKDGSYQVGHKTITQRLDKNGKASLTTDDDISNTTKKNFNVNASENVNFQTPKTFGIDAKDFTASASGSASFSSQKFSVMAQSDATLSANKVTIEAQSLAMIKATTVVLDGNVALGGQGGQPVLLLSTILIGTGNLGAPVISQAISGYALKVTAQ